MREKHCLRSSASRAACAIFMKRTFSAVEAEKRFRSGGYSLCPGRDWILSGSRFRRRQADMRLTQNVFLESCINITEGDPDIRYVSGILFWTRRDRLFTACGTVVETVDTPFFQPVKGVVFNQKEPWEEGFGEDDEQWLLYADFLHGGNRTGIGAIKLDHYASITFGADFLLPFVQFLRRREGETEEKEKWLEDLGELLKKDKRYFGMILRDHMPAKTPDIDERCREYVKKLSER